MKKILLSLILLTTFSTYSQIRDLKNKCNGHTFDLTEQYILLTDSYPDEKIIVSYHLSLAEATSGANPIVNPENYTTTPNTPVIYARINNNGVISTNYFNLDFIPFVAFLQSVSNTTGLGKNDGQALISFRSGYSYILVSLTKNGNSFEDWIENPDQNFVNYSGLTPGDYVCHISDQFCVAEVAFKITDLTITTAAIDKTITAVATGGTPPYQYAIDGSNYQESNIFTNVKTGTNTVTARDNNSSVATSLIDIAPTAIDAINKTLSLALNGNTSNNTPSVLTNYLLNGSAVLPSDIDLTTVSAPIGFILNPNGTITVAAETVSGVYNLTYQICQKTDSTNCDTETVSIMVTKATQIPDLTSSCNAYNLTRQYPLLIGNLNPNQTVITYHTSFSDATNGVNAITYPEYYANLVDDTFIYTRMTNTGIITTNYFKLVHSFDFPFISTSSYTSGLGKNNGFAELIFNGAVPTLRADLNNTTTNVHFPVPLFQNLPFQQILIQNLTSGIYEYHTIDENHCFNLSRFTIADNPLNFTTTVVDKTITVTATEGIPPYQYAINGTNYQESNIFTNVKTGTNTVTVMDQYGYVATSVIVIAPTPIDAIDKTFSLSLSGTADNNTPSVLANDLLNGSPVSLSDINLTTVSAPAGFILNPNGTITVTAETVSGNYNLTYQICQKSDPTNCDTATVTIMVTKATPIADLASMCNYYDLTRQKQLLIGNLDPNQTTITYHLSLYDATNGINAIANPEYYDNLIDNTFIYARMDSASVISTNSFKLVHTYGPPPFISTSGYTSGLGKNDGFAELIIPDGVPIIFVEIINTTTGVYFPVPFYSNQPFQQIPIQNLNFGIYECRILDENHCITISQFTIADDPLNFTTIVTDKTITVNATGGIPPYSYAIGYDYYNSMNVFSGLSVGKHIISVRDSSYQRLDSEVTISEPGTLNATTTFTNVSCYEGNNGSITITATGGNPPYTYSKDGNNYAGNNILNNLVTGTYTTYVKDANGSVVSNVSTITQPYPLSISSSTASLTCGNERSITITATGGEAPYTYSKDGINYDSYNTFSNLESGIYTMYAKDRNGCVTTELIPQNLPASFYIVPSVTNVSCNGNKDGSITLSVIGGSGSYKYQMSGDVLKSDNKYSGLAAGTYTITATDTILGCATSTNITITEPAVLNTTTIISNITCSNNGSITIAATGGQAPYTYSKDGIAYNSIKTFLNLVPGTYTLYAKDNNGCISTNSTTLVQPTPLVINATYTSVRCKGNSDGSITLNTTGGSGSYTYSINGITTQNSNVFTGLAAGTYTIIVTDSNSCTASITTTIIEPTALTATTAVSNQTIIAIAAEGTPPYQYSIDNEMPQSTDTFTNVAPGSYVVFIKDQNGCIAANPIIVDPSVPLINGNSIITQNFSQGQTLGDIVVQGENIKWYSNPTPSTGKSKKLNETSLPLSTVLVNNTTYYASQTINGIESTERLAVTVKLDALATNDFAIKDFTYYPNPVKDIFTISNTSVIEEATLISLKGQTLLTKKINNLHSEIDLSNFSKGVYFLKVKSGGTEKTVKIIKE
jgi:hypothetical protein